MHIKREKLPFLCGRQNICIKFLYDMNTENSINFFFAIKKKGYSMQNAYFGQSQVSYIICIANYSVVRKNSNQEEEKKRNQQYNYYCFQRN
jgi:hypothetical protein